jgi:CDP-diacylglycerol--glycerol-3-phosphate 3-phosphatidyltransferase
MARGLLRMKVTPDMVTMTGTILTVLVALILIPQGNFIPAVILLFIFSMKLFVRGMTDGAVKG